MSFIDGAKLVRNQPRRGEAVVIEHLRDLEPSDLELLSRPKATKTPRLQRVKDSHHALARLVAEGRSTTECSAITGYGPGRIQMLRNDPTFIELVNYYREHTNAAYADTHHRLATVANMALDEIRERIEDEESVGKMSDETLLAISKMGADRTGHGPQVKNAHVHVHVGQAERLAAARERVANSRASARDQGLGPVIEGEVQDVQSLPAPAAA